MASVRHAVALIGRTVARYRSARTFLIATACGIVYASIVSSGQTSVAGTWRVESTPPARSWTAVFRIDGNRLVGTVSSCLSADGVVEIENGTVDGNRVTFTCSRGARAGLRVLTFAGIVRGDELRLAWGKSGPGGGGSNDPFFGATRPSEITLRRIPDASDATSTELKTAADKIRVTPSVPFERVQKSDTEPQNWLTYSGNLMGQRHSALTQVTPANVKDLELAWVWQAQTKNCTVATCGTSNAQFQATPLVVDGVLYTSRPPAGVVALDAATGRELWAHEYTPAMAAFASGGGGRPNRGVAISGGTIFLGAIDARLRAMDAFSGKLKWEVVVADPADPTCQGRQCYVITHAPLVVKDMVLLGVGGGDGPNRGFVAAFDERTGELRWKFHTIPGPGEVGNDSWAGDSWRTGGGGVWQIGSYDAALNLTYWGVGNPFPTYDGSTRKGDNLYSSSVIALDADTGKLRWHYQFTPHDVMDWDSAHVPVLADITVRNEPRKTMLWADKNGLMYALDRANGQFLLGKPFVQVNWMNGFDAAGRPQRTPPKEGEPIYPFVATNWYPPSFNSTTGLFYVSARQRSGRQGGGTTSPGPGYGAIVALDPATGDQKWEFRRDDAMFTTGVLSTASGLLFTGASGDPAAEPRAAAREDRYFYALDAATGAQLWRVALPGDLRGSPMTYAVDGTQYIAIAAGDTLISFSLRR
jgi:alcohol dehydrogenase (cytochrome c)